MAKGVDGLEVGHQYRLGVNGGFGSIRWWEWGEKEEVIRSAGKGGKRLDGRRVAYGFGKEPHEMILIDREGVEEIEFWCVE